MSNTNNTNSDNPLSQPTHEGVEAVALNPAQTLRDYRDAMNLSNRVADEKLGTHMLLSWYDRDRNFESPQNSSRRQSDSAIPGYVDYAIYNGATLKVDVENGRFVFFYLSTDL